MAKTDTFVCSVVTPEGVVAEIEARFVVLPAHDGEIGVLHDRAPLLCKLDVGRLRIETPAEKLVFYVDGGVAEMVNNQRARSRSGRSRLERGQIDVGDR